MPERILQVVIKEFLELWRDRWSRFRLLVPPIIQMLIFGYAATFEVFGVSTAVVDLDHSQESRELVAGFGSSERFHVVEVATTSQAVEAAIEQSDATVALVVHAGFAEKLRKGQPAPVQVLVDGTNSNTALIALSYVGEIVQRFSAAYQLDLAERVLPGPKTAPVEVTLEARPWYNPDLNSRWFFVPGVIGTLTLTIVVNLTAFAIVREREVGTLEQIMVTPIRPLEFVLGKTAPFFLVGLGEVMLIALTGTIWFGVPFVGNPLVLLLGTSLFLLSTLGLGLLISTICTTQQQAFASNFFVVNPLFTLSGFSFPISSMPGALQAITYVNPLRYYLIIIRGTFLKGVGLDVLWPDMLALAALGIGLLGLSVVRFRKSLD
ncbi:MAG TPA: ABC transporter permease [Stellaceae bacterium]|nr:ABC transporter permease [Stellaceae bacterium]